MGVAHPVVNDRFLLNALLGNLQGKVYGAIRGGRGGEYPKLERVQTFARVAVAQLRQMTPRVIIYSDFVITKPTSRISQCPIDQKLELFDRERLELENERTRNQRAIDVKVRVVSGRPD